MLKCNDTSKIAQDSTDDLSRDHTLTRRSPSTSIEPKLEQDGSKISEVSARRSLKSPRSCVQPKNLADHDLTSEAESLKHQPRHGNLVSSRCQNSEAISFVPRRPLSSYSHIL